MQDAILVAQAGAAPRPFTRPTTNWYRHDGSILRYVFFHSIALAALVGILVYLQAYVPPFTSMVVK